MAVLKQQVSKPPLFIDTAAKGGFAVYFFLFHPPNCSKKVYFSNVSNLVMDAKNVTF